MKRKIKNQLRQRSLVNQNKLMKILLHPSHHHQILRMTKKNKPLKLLKQMQERMLKRQPLKLPRSNKKNKTNKSN
jgi:hypothetical protein